MQSSCCGATIRAQSAAWGAREIDPQTLYFIVVLCRGMSMASPHLAALFVDVTPMMKSSRVCSTFPRRRHQSLAAEPLLRRITPGVTSSAASRGNAAALKQHGWYQSVYTASTTTSHRAPAASTATTTCHLAPVI